MIKRDSTITVNNNVATLDNDIYLYKYDKNIQITFTIVNSKYMYDNDSTNNLVANAQASYAQVKFKKDDDATNTIEIEFDIQATKKGAVILAISEELTDEDTEIGDYSIQIRLLDSKKEAVLTLPPIKSCIHIQQPLFEKLGASNLTDDAIVDQALTTYAAPLKAVEDDGTFAKKTWVAKEKITTAELNRMEDGIGYNNTQLKDIKSTQIVLEKDDTSFKGIEDTTHDTLTTTNKTIIGGINEVNSQIKNIASKTIDTISSKVLATVPANNIKLEDEITINNVSFNGDRKYYIEFLGVNKLCNLLISESIGNSIVCNINNYVIEGFNDSTDMCLAISKINTDINDETFTDLVIYEEEVKCLDSKYLESDLVLQNSISIGRIGNIGYGSSAIGYSVEASGSSSHAEGDSTTASGESSHAEGSGTIALGDSSHAEGTITKASGIHSHAEGESTTASGKNSHAEGAITIASGQESHAEGFCTKASSDYQHVQGKFNIEDTANKYAHIVGNGKYDNTRSNAHTLDWAGNAWYAGDVQANNVPYVASEKVVLTVPAASISAKKTEIINAAGNIVQIPVDGAVTYDPTKSYYAKYNNTQYHVIYVDGGFSIIGDGCKCAIMSISANNVILAVISLDVTNITDMQLIEKDIKKLDNMYIPNDLDVNNSITVGARNGTIGHFSSSFGLNCEASGDKSHAEGFATTASGKSSHAEGDGTIASGKNSHAEGENTTASGYGSHTEGFATTASGKSSHAEGYNTTASGRDSHAEGIYTKASSEYQHVQGRYNIEDTENKYAHIVGNGSDNTRSNAHTLDWNGNAWFAGKLSQEGTPTEDKDLVTKKYVADKISSLPQLSFTESGELVVTINGVSKTFVPKSEQ